MTGLPTKLPYGQETYTNKEIRLAEAAQDPRPGIDRDLPTDRTDDHEPVPWWAVAPSFKTCALPVFSSFAGSRRTAAPAPDRSPQGAAHSAAGGLGGTCSPAAPPSSKAA